ncbi:MAG: DUF3330 domain-containing protein [Legionellaceae bacterium]|nr:DUF3330 domain-containing protein [Legionellaceae bacterium]
MTEKYDMKICCIVCGKEMPESARKNPEGGYYIDYFCSTPCLDMWEKEKTTQDNFPFIMANPTKYYQHPHDIVNDIKLSTEQRLKVLASWESDAISMERAAEENMGNGDESLLKEIKDAIITLQQRP